MCTAISYSGYNVYFGRNLDLEHLYDEAVTIVPRNFPLNFKKEESLKNHYSIIGMSTIIDNYPLFYDATNEHGLSMAGLNFVGNAVYHEYEYGKKNLATFEFIPYILATCKTVEEAMIALVGLNITNTPFDENTQSAMLHWIISDKAESMTIESMEDGIRIYKNPLGVLTNNPPFDYHLTNLNNYLNLTADEPKNRFSKDVELEPYSRGMGAMGMPGDLSSSSRFIRATFTKSNSPKMRSEERSVAHFFHILGSVEMCEGSVRVGRKNERTQYSSCVNVNDGIYYYRTYGNSRITAIRMRNENLDSTKLISYPIRHKNDILFEN
jgi:choloylglycine hydrolase